MKLVSLRHNHFLLHDHLGNEAAELIYGSENFSEGQIKANDHFFIRYEETGCWSSYRGDKSKGKKIAEIRLKAGGLMILSYMAGRKKYVLKRTGIFKARFVLFNKDREEILALLPLINWRKNGYEFTLQVNEEFSSECSSLLILHALHCANYYLHMLNGTVPALINI